MDGTKPDVEYAGGYSAALLALGALLLIGGLEMRFSLVQGTKDDPAMAFVSSILYLLGGASLVVSLLRWLRARAALPATAALSWVLIASFPFGTMLWAYWFFSVRLKERMAPDQLNRSWFNGTVALFVLSLLAVDTALFSRWMRQTGPDAGLFAAFEGGAWIVAAILLALAFFGSTRAFAVTSSDRPPSSSAR